MILARCERGLGAALAAATLCVFGLLACGERPQRPVASRSVARAAAIETLALRESIEIERKLTEKEALRFDVVLKKGEYLHALVEQGGLDVKVEIRGPGGPVLTRFDHSEGSEIPEEVFFVATVRGRHRIEISAPKPRKASAVFLRADALRPASESDKERARASREYALARELDRGGAPRSAVRSRYQGAAALWRRLGDEPREAWALFFMGKLDARDRRFPAALETLRRSTDLFEQSDRLAFGAEALVELGIIRHDLEDFDGEAQAYLEAIELLRTIDDRTQIAARTNDLALVRVRQGRFDEALDHFAAAIETFESERNAAELAKVYFNRGSLYAAIGGSRRALDDLHHSLSLLDREDDFALWATVSTRIGDQLLELGDVDAAVVRLKDALALRRGGDESEVVVKENGVAVTLVSLGLAELERQRPEAALSAFREAAEIFERLDRPYSHAVVLNHLGRSYERLGRAVRAQQLFEQALRQSHHDPQRQVESIATFGLARVTARQGRFEQAEQWIERTVSLTEAMVARMPTPDLRAGFVFDREEQYGFLIDLLAARAQRGKGHDLVDRAFAVQERAEARVLLELFSGARRKRDSPSTARLAELRREINGRHLQRIQGARRSPSLNPSDADGAIRRLLADYSREEAAPPADRGLPLVPSLSVVQRDLLDDQTLLLEFHLGAERSYLWAATRSERRFVVLPPRAAIDRLADRAYRLLAQSHFETDQVAALQASARLSRTLFAPVADLLGKRRLVVVASGSLARIPFAALHDPRAPSVISGLARYRPLILEHEVVNVPSAAILSILRARSSRPKPRGLLAMVADPVFDPADERLPRPARGVGYLGSAPQAETSTLRRLAFAGREAKAILGLVPHERTLEATGFAANRSLFEDGRLDDFRILHFATHGLFEDIAPELSALALSSWHADGRPRDGLIRAYELIERNLHADLVVASACRTALDGDGRTGQGGLTQAFLRAGAQRVIVSLWDADDRATSELMIRFYRGLLVEQLTPSQALRRAQVSLLKEPRWTAPYFWASFVMEGDWI